MVAFQLTNLFHFYGKRFTELVPANSAIVVLFDECKTTAMSSFDKLLDLATDKLKVSPPVRKVCHLVCLSLFMLLGSGPSL